MATYSVIRCQISVDALAVGASASLSPDMGAVRYSWATLAALSAFAPLDLFPRHLDPRPLAMTDLGTT